MSNLKWQPFSESCPHCGDGSEVLTLSGESELAYDGDFARCVSCQWPGSVIMAEEDEGDFSYIQWHDEEDCDCEHCERLNEEENNESNN